MRILSASLGFLGGLAAVVLLAPAPLAQTQPGCTSATDACPVEIAVDETGFTAVSWQNFTVGDWHTLSISNEDTKATATDEGQTHTVTLSGHSVSVTLQPLDTEDVVVQFTTVGCYDLKDMPTGDIVKIRVVEADSIDFEQKVAPDADPCANNGLVPNPQPSGNNSKASGTDVSSSKGMPGVDLVAVLAGLAAVAFASRSLVARR